VNTNGDGRAAWLNEDTESTVRFKQLGGRGLVKAEKQKI